AARQEAARLAEAQAASRSSSRTSLTTTQSQGVDLPAAASGSAVVSYAAEFQGVPYVIGGTTPAGFDCSGFTQFVYAKFGISLPRVDNDQRTWAQSHGTRVSNPQPGDLMWLPGHVGIYVGNGLMIHAPRPGKSVSIVPVYSSSFEYYHILSD
ncbi:C40 family peptidase, partial [Bifidobacterium leontopitheci]